MMDYRKQATSCELVSSGIISDPKHWNAQGKAFNTFLTNLKQKRPSQLNLWKPFCVETQYADSGLPSMMTMHNNTISLTDEKSQNPGIILLQIFLPTEGTTRFIFQIPERII